LLILEVTSDYSLQSGLGQKNLQLSDGSYRCIEECHCMFPAKLLSEKGFLKRNILAVYDESILLHILSNPEKYLVFQDFDQ
jgi:hypothetical protein